MSQSQHTWNTAESATLAAAIRDPGFCARVLDAGVDVFTGDVSRRAWKVLQQLTRDGHPVDAASVEVALGGPVPGSPSTDYWAVLLEQRLYRQLQQIGRWLLKSHDGVSPTAVAARTLQSLNQAMMATQHSEVLSSAEAAQAGLAALAAGSPHWLASDISLLDIATAGWGPDDLILVGARPSQGKTALGLQWAWKTASQQRGTVFCSVEMGPAAIGMRAVTQLTEWPLDLLRQRLSDPYVAQAAQDLASWPWRVIDASGASVADLQAAVARADLQGPRSDVVIVDYLQILRGPERMASREQEITRIATDLKNWARRDHRLVMGLVQLSRKVEDRLDRMPQLSDMRESGALEQVADGVILIHHTPDSDGAQLIVAKNRNGPTGSVPVRWHAATMQFMTTT